MEHLLRVVSDHFVAGAVFSGRECIRTAPILSYFRGMEPERIKEYIEKKGWRYQWL